MAKQTRIFQWLSNAKYKIDPLFEAITMALFVATLLLGSFIPWILTSAASASLADDPRFVAFARRFGRNPILLWRIGHGDSSEDGPPWFLDRDLGRLNKAPPPIAAWIKKAPFWGDMIAFDAFGFAPIAADANDRDRQFVEAATAYAERDDLRVACSDSSSSQTVRSRRL